MNIEDKLKSKRDKIKELDGKINILNKRKSKLNSEIFLLEAKLKAEKYEKLEISLKNSGLTLEDLIKKASSGDL